MSEIVSRHLTQGEIALARTVYGDTIDYSSVIVSNGKYLPFQGNNYAVSPNGEIYFADTYYDDFSTENLNAKAHFIHEMGHVYQHDSGINVTVRGLAVQVPHLLGAVDAYDFRSVMRSGVPFHEWTIEQQASYYQEYFYQREYNRITGHDDIRDRNQDGKIDHPVSINELEAVDDLRLFPTNHQAGIDVFGSIGRILGTQLANILLEDESQFTRVLGGTLLGTVTENLSEVISSVGFDAFNGRQFNFGNALSSAIDEQLGNVDAEFKAGLVSAMSALFVSELGEKLGLDGFGAELFGVTAGTYTGSIADQLLATGNPNFTGVDWTAPFANITGVWGTFFGSQLANEILPADTVAGSVGGTLGSLVGTSWGGSYLGGLFGNSLGAIGNFLIPGVGSFIGTLLGTFLGDLFGDEPEPGASFLMFAEQQGENIIPGVLDYYLYATAQDGFPSDYTQALGEAVIDLSREYMSNIGAFDMANANIDNFSLPPIYQNNDPHDLGSNPLIRVLQRMNIDAANGDNLRFYVNGREVNSAEAMVDGAVTDFLRDSQPIGGNIFLKRAIANSAGDTSLTLSAAMATAAEYERYLEDKEAINALIAASPDSAFSGAWVYTLAGAEELRLSRVNQTDFNGGLGGLLNSLIEAGVAVDPTNATVQRGANGRVLVNVRVDDAESIPSYIDLFANNVQVTETANGAVIQFIYGNNMAPVGYKNLASSTAISGTNRYDVAGESNGRDLWIAADNRNYNFTDRGTHTIRVGAREIESSDDILIARGGHDRINAGTGWDWIDGGGGRDTLHGGNQDDTIFGGGGNDLIYGGHQMDYLEGGAGADTIFGTAQGDSGDQLDPLYHATDYATAGYTRSNAAVHINLGAGTASGGHATGDRLHHIINLVGSNHNDVLIGSGIANWLEGGAGADTLNGGNDTVVPPGESAVPPDFASYFHAHEGVTASLANSNANTGDAEGDIYWRIEGLEGSNFDDLLIGDENNNFLMGMAGDDILIVGPGQDSVRGGFGFDVMSYRHQSSGIKINLGNWSASSAVVRNDVRNENDIEGYEGTNHNDTLLGSGTGDVLIGRAGNDNINGRAGNDALIGDAGHDSLNGGAGADTMNGGSGNDIYWVDNIDDMLIETSDGGRDRINSSIGIDLNRRNDAYADVEHITLTGTKNLKALGSATNNHLVGNNGANFLSGRDGNDLIQGNGGQDSLLGGSGNDRLFGNAGNDILIGGTGADQFNGGGGSDQASYKDATSGVRADLAAPGTNTGEARGDTYVSIEQLIGSNHADNLRGNGGANTIAGANGNDMLYGHNGNDVLKGQNSNDILIGGNGADRLDGGTGIDRASYEDATNRVTADLQNAARNTGIAKGDKYTSIEHLQGSNHNDDLRGNGGNNTIWGRTGNDAIRGQGGNDVLIGDAGNDILIGGAGADTLNGGAGIDTLSYATATTAISIGLWDNSASRGEAAGDVISNFENVTGGAGNDLLSGNSANNLLQGGAGSDTLHGGAGTDRLIGGGGKDILHGGAGDDVRDVFIFQSAGQSTRGAARDVIFDFASGLDDINLAQIDADNTAAGNQAFAWSGATARAHGIWTVQVGDHRLVRGDVNGDRNFDFEIEVRDIARLAADDFIF